MGMRITTGMMMNTYRYNLQGSTKNLSDARNKVLSGRNFDSYATDPAAATQAWRIRRAMSRNFNYQTNNDDTYSRFNIAWTTMGVVNGALEDKDGRFSTIRGINGTAGAGRQPLGQVLDAAAETIVEAMNSAKYGDHFVFAGDDEMNAPFSWSSDMKTLYYRGVNVNAGAVARPDSPEPTWGNPDPDNFGMPENMPAEKDLKTDEEREWYAYYRDQGDVKKLEMLSKEEQNVDLGMGLQEDREGNLINGTAFNRSLPGLNMLGGFGVDEDGDPKNAVLLMKRLGELCGNADPNSGAWDPDPVKAEEIQVEAERLLTKLTNAHHRTTEAYTEIETRAHFLQENQTRLKTQGDYLQEERANLEQVDLADAITEFSWDYYCYSSALKVGTQLLSNSLLDYMR